MSARLQLAIVDCGNDAVDLGVEGGELAVQVDSALANACVACARWSARLAYRLRYFQYFLDPLVSSHVAADH